MKLLKIKLNNFISHGNSELAFPEGLLLVDGKSGHGKSSVCEAVTWCLYGKGRLDSRSLIRKGQPHAEVILEVSSDERVYSIARKIRDSGRHDLDVTVMEGEGFVPVNAKGIKDAQEFIENTITGSSYQLFVNSVVHLQDSKDSFVRQDAKRRKELLLELTNVTEYSRLESLAKKSLPKAKENLASLLAVKNLTESNIKIAQNESSSLQDLKSEFEQVLKELPILVMKNEGRMKALSQLEFATEKLQSLDKSLKDLESRIFTDKNKLDDMLKAFKDAKSTKDSVVKHAERLKEINSAERAYGDWERDALKLEAERPADLKLEMRVREIENQINSLETRKVEDCPETGKPCGIITKERDERLKELKTRLKTEKERLNEYNEAEQEFTKKVLELEKVRVPKPNTEEKERIENEIKKLENELLKLPTESELSSKKDILNDLEKEAEKIRKSRDEQLDNERIIKKELSSVPDVEDDLKKLLEKKDKLGVSVALAENSAKLLKEYDKELIELSKKESDARYDIECLSLIREALGPSGLTAMVIDHLIPTLEKRINDILGKLSDFRVRLDTQKKGLGKDTTLEGLFISIINGQGEEFDYDGYSGGERLKIMVAISEALSEMQKANFRILDELFVGLDEESTEKFAEILVELNDRFSQLVCVSHLRDIRELFPNKVTAVKVNGISKLITEK